MPLARDVVFLAGARTPIGRFLGGLSEVSATALGAAAASAAIERSGVPAADVQATYFGNVIPTSEDAAYIARHVGMDAGLPIEAPALTVNRACGSAMEAAIQGAKSLMLREHDLVLVGGAENMSMTPYAMRGTRKAPRTSQSRSIARPPSDS